MEYFGKTVQQCEQANARLGRTDCCKSHTPPACIAGGWPELPRYGFEFKKTSAAALAWPQVQAQLAPRDPNNPCSFTPFAFSWHWVGGSGHMMVAIGYKVTSDGKRYVLINDPWPPSKGSTQYILYDAYVELAGDHTHWDDFYDVKPLSQGP
jgi:Papain-like cysteine protease AvrRpt2